MTSYCGAFQFTLMQMAGCNPSINPETGKGSFLFIHSVPSSIRQRQCRLGCSYRSLIHPGNNNTQANAVTLYAAPMRNPDAGNRTQAWTALTQRGCLPLCPRGRSNTMIVQQIPNKPRRKREKMREKEHTPSAVYTRRRRSPRSSRERCKLQLLSLQLTRRRRKAMPDSTADNAPPLALILVKRLAQASDLPPTKSISPMLPHPFLPSMQASQGKRERGKNPPAHPSTRPLSPSASCSTAPAACHCSCRGRTPRFASMSSRAAPSAPIAARRRGV